MLLDHGAQLTIDGDHQGCHLLHFAVDRGLFDIAKLFLSKDRIPVDQTNERGWPPLHLAAGHNHLALAKLLLDHGADINFPVRNSFD